MMRFLTEAWLHANGAGVVSGYQTSQKSSEVERQRGNFPDRPSLFSALVVPSYAAFAGVFNASIPGTNFRKSAWQLLQQG